MGKIKLPGAILGVRGTIGGGTVRPGGSSLVVLMGPGEHHNTGHKTGALSVTSEVGGRTKQVNVTRTGYGTTIEPGEAPKTPAPVPANVISDISSSLRVESDDPSEQNVAPEAGEASASANAGQDTFKGSGQLLNTESVRMIGVIMDEETGEASLTAQQLGRLSERTSTFDELRKVGGGIFHFPQGTSFFEELGPTPTIGRLVGDLQIDFNKRILAGGNSKIRICTAGCGLGLGGNIDQTITIPGLSFAQANGFASARIVAGPTILTASFENKNGTLALAGKVDVAFDDGGGTTGRGFASGDRQPGAAVDVTGLLD